MKIIHRNRVQIRKASDDPQIDGFFRLGSIALHDAAPAALAVVFCFFWGTCPPVLRIPCHAFPPASQVAFLILPSSFCLRKSVPAAFLSAISLTPNSLNRSITSSINVLHFVPRAPRISGFILPPSAFSLRIRASARRETGLHWKLLGAPGKNLPSSVMSIPKEIAPQ